MKHLIPKTMTVVPVMALALAVGGCGSSSDDDDDMVVGPTPEEECTGAGGEWANGMCTTAEELAEARRVEQRAAINTAIMDATAKVNAVGNDSTDAEVSAADAAITAARTAIAAAADVPMGEKDARTGTVDNLATQLSGAKMARMEAMNEAEMAEREAMAATAAKLYAGINAPVGTDGTGNDDRFARYDTTNETTIEVFIGTGDAAGTAIILSEDKDTMVADNHGWEGKRYADPAGGDMVEAYVYSNVEAPTEGDKFGQVGVTAAADGYEYGLEADGETADAFTFVAGNVASPSFDHTAGTKEFELPTNAVRVMVAGSYHGVSGTYYCTPAASSTCAAQVAADGFTLGGTADADNAFTAGGGAWNFKPTNPEARVMVEDTAYASYGWWLRKAANDGPFTASAFVDEKGTVADAAGLDALNGKATYMGGAAGKYALASSTGGTNDAGHFTARAMLEANFTTNDGTDTTTNAITGTIDQFIGADGMARDWSVKLNGSPITNTGGIGEAGDTTAGNAMTEWTIGGTAADDAGTWTGNLRNNGDDGVPKVATGTFYSEYGTAGKMVGAFGANKQ